LDVKGITEDEQKKDKLATVKMLDEYFARAWEFKKAKNQQMVKQEELNANMEERRLRMKELQADNEEQRQVMQTQSKVIVLEEDRCEKLEEEYAIRVSIREEDIENIAKLISLLRSLYDKKEPVKCLRGKPGTEEVLPDGTEEPATKGIMCTHKDHGWCIFNTESGNDQRCSCNVGFYGDICEHKMCPGMGMVLHKSGSDGACSGHGKCDSSSGMCESCEEPFYHGAKNGCELHHCPVSANGVVDEKCSDHGVCDTKRGKCNCEYEWSGPGCENKKCPNSNSVLYPVESANACDGRGACSKDLGTCTCGAPYFGKTCEFSKCPRDCSSRGACNENEGKCNCQEGYDGPACEFVSCPDDCSGGGECNRLSGKCICKMGFSGDRCRKSTRCSADRGDGYAIDGINWYSVWDKPGWITCPPGQIVHALRRSVCDALSCLDSGSCAAPCEGESTSSEKIEVRHCYHALDWYASMDKEGWSKCEANYFVAGLYRSGDSLYNLQMAKCCSFKKARWSECSEMNWATKFNGPGWVRSPDHKFLAGLYRGTGHRLRDIDKAYTCGWVRGY